MLDKYIQSYRFPAIIPEKFKDFIDNHKLAVLLERRKPDLDEWVITHKGWLLAQAANTWVDSIKDACIFTLEEATERLNQGILIYENTGAFKVKLETEYTVEESSAVQPKLVDSKPATIAYKKYVPRFVDPEE